jgi:class 3 adenylate cyclase/streptogramin lyase
VTRSAQGRRLATVLFLDIVGSTRVASELGDARWRTLLTRFNKVVRAEIRAHGGREENFTGDGFLATFPEPARAVAAGDAIVRAVQELGVDVRVGIHTGEVETIGKQLGGVAVHIGARVMAQAGAAEVLTTGTVRDLVHGSAIDFDDAGTHELKGVPGTWDLVAVRSIMRAPGPQALDPAEAARRLEAIEAEGSTVRRRRRVGIAAAAVLVVVGAAVWVAVASKGTASAISLVKIDGTDAKIEGTVDDGLITDHLWRALSVENGALFQMTPSAVRSRDLVSGQVLQSFSTSEDHDVSAIGFGSEWLGSKADTRSIQRVDLVSGRVVDSIDVKGGAGVLAVGPDAVWFVTTEGRLGRVDPISMDVQTWSSGAVSPGAVVPFRDSVWICDCDNGQIIRFDIATERFTTFDIPERAYLVGPTQSGGAFGDLWLVDQEASTVTPLDPHTGEPGRPIGFQGTLADAEVGLGKIWVAAADHVYVLNATNDQADVIDVPMPPGFFASSVAIDTQNQTVWIGACGCPLDEA